jgi:hypothetical protein
VGRPLYPCFFKKARKGTMFFCNLGVQGPNIIVEPMKKYFFLAFHGLIALVWMKLGGRRGMVIAC